jgi:glucose-1-phosphate thymidylyltransferase
MKGAVLAGGLGTRLYPLTHATHKQLLPVYDKPMIYYPIQTLVKAGISDIMVICSGPHAGDTLRVLQNGKEFGIGHLEYTYQQNPEGGIADAIRYCEDFADRGPLTIILGDNTTDADISKEVKNFKSGALVFLKKVHDPQRFGVPIFNKKNQIIKIIEKPKKPASNFAVTGLYIYDNTVFDKIRKIKPSSRGQLEVTDLNNLYLKEGKLQWAELKGFWSDAGSFESLYLVNTYWARKHKSKAFWEELLSNSKS